MSNPTALSIGEALATVLGDAEDRWPIQLGEVRDGVIELVVPLVMAPPRLVSLHVGEDGVRQDQVADRLRALGHRVTLSKGPTQASAQAAAASLPIRRIAINPTGE